MSSVAPPSRRQAEGGGSSGVGGVRPKTTDWQRDVVCKYFFHGVCSREDNCSYSHDMSLSTRGTIPCKYYQHGTCAYGDGCRFRHASPASSSELNPNAKEFTLRPMTADVSTADTSWAEAPEFVPAAATRKKEQKKRDGKKTWAQVVDAERAGQLTVEEAESQLCPFSMVGECRYGLQCSYVHGRVCEMCGVPNLHPHNERQREHHEKLCMQHHEKQMELAFAVKRSKSKTCGICMEVVMDKKPQVAARFGILPNCNHCFCLDCLRKWRQAKQFENKIVRACPECRQTSDYICPSRFWIDTKQEKEELLSNYKAELQRKKCKYFNEGAGVCPFGNRCFYRHEKPDGEPVDVGPPERQQRRVKRATELDDADDRALITSILLHDFLEMRQELGASDSGFQMEEVLDILDLLSDSDSDW